jgi:hypothetical protein
MMDMEDNTIKEKYVVYFKNNINEYIENNDYKGAFQALVTLLNRVDDEQKRAVIKYYDDLMFDMYVKMGY